MKIAIPDLTNKVYEYLIKAGLDHRDASTLTSLILEQEMVGNQFSPIGELSGKHSRLIKHLTNKKEEIVVAKPAMMLFKGNGRPAPLITADRLADVISKAKTQGIFAMGIYDSTYNEFFDIFCRRIASQDCIGIIVENGGPQGVVPFGGRKDVTGTNPIAYGIPTNEYPIVFDGATAMHAWSRITQAKARHQKLPDNAYVDVNGDVTTDPHLAVAVLPFGGFKGYAINILIDVLSGALVRGRSGLDMPLEAERYIGTFIIVIDPAAFGEITEFKKATTKLAHDILAVPPVDPTRPVKVPGFRGSLRMEKFKKEGYIEIEDEEWKKFTNASR